MRNLISLAIAFAVVLTENDVLELGYDVTPEDFKQYFEIPEDAVEGEFKKSEDFAPTSIIQFMNAEESSQFEAPAKEEAKTETAAEKKKREAAEKKAQKEADKKAAADKKTEDKETASAEPKKPGIITSILEIITAAESPVSEADILKGLVERFPDKESASMHKTIKAQLGGKNQPLRMETEKKVTFVLTQTEAKEGEKSQRLYAIAK